MIAVLPGAQDVRELLSDLLGRPVPLRTVDVWVPGPADDPCTAEFVDDQGALRALAVMDLKLTVFLGASVGLIPAGGAQDMVQERSASAMVLENAYEVLNIVSALFNTPQNPHLRLGKVSAPGTGIPASIDTILHSLANRIDLTVDVPGYGSGQLVLAGA